MKRRRSARALGTVLLCAVLLACAKSQPRIATSDAGLPRATQADASVPGTQDAAKPSGAPLGEQGRPKPRMHVRAQHGTALAVGTEIDQTLTVQLAQGDALTLSLDDYVRVQLTGPATAQLLPAGQAALLLRDGLVTVDVSPRGVRSSASAFWLATPAARLDVADSVRVAVRAFPNGPSQVEVVSGYLTLSQVAAPLAMPAGAAGCATLDGAKLTSARSATLERAEAELARARACAPKASVTSALLESALTDQLHLVSDALEHERVQLEEHARLVAVSDAGVGDASATAVANTAAANADKAREIRSELARTGAALLRTRERARALRAQFEASALGRELSAAEEPLLRHATKLSVIH